MVPVNSSNFSEVGLYETPPVSLPSPPAFGFTNKAPSLPFLPFSPFAIAPIPLLDAVEEFSLIVCSKSLLFEHELVSLHVVTALYALASATITDVEISKATCSIVLLVDRFPFLFTFSATATHVPKVSFHIIR